MMDKIAIKTITVPSGQENPPCPECDETLAEAPWYHVLDWICDKCETGYVYHPTGGEDE